MQISSTNRYICPIQSVKYAVARKRPVGQICEIYKIIKGRKLLKRNYYEPDWVSASYTYEEMRRHNIDKFFFEEIDEECGEYLEIELDK